MCKGKGVFTDMFDGLRCDGATGDITAKFS